MTYSTLDGSMVQKISLDFIPVVMKDLKWLECNQNDLLLLDLDGTARIFHYTYPSDKFPLRGIIAICIAVLIILIVVTLLVYRWKKKSKNKNKNDISLLSEE